MYVLESLNDLAVAPLGQGWGLCGTRSDVYDAAKMSRLTQSTPPNLLILLCAFFQLSIGIVSLRTISLGFTSAIFDSLQAFL